MSLLVVFKMLFNLIKKLPARITEFIIAAINTFFLTIIYIFFIGLTAATAKVVGKSFLTTQNKKLTTYWIDKKKTQVKMEEYHKQF